jgi:hypothetical protein
MQTLKNKRYGPSARLNIPKPPGAFTNSPSTMPTSPLILKK